MCRAQGGRHLPAAGGIGDQPAALWDVFRMLPDLWDKSEKQEKGECSD